jgi:ribokinase
MRVAVVGHVEVVEFVRVPRVPVAGEIARATETWEEAAGGGAVAAVQLARLAGACTLYTALGDDERGRAVPRRLALHGVRVENAWRAEKQRRGITFVDDHAERTITVIGPRHQPEAGDALPWGDLDVTDAVYFTAGSPEVVRLARRARVLVATSRVMPLLEEAGVVLDAVVRSAKDPGEPDPASSSRLPTPLLSVATEGANGGSYTTADGRRGRWSAAPLPGPAIDSYGCGDSFAAGLTFALAQRLSVDDALAFAARCGAAALTGRGPFGGQLTLTSTACAGAD